MDNNFTCNCTETVSRLGIEYQFDYNCKKIKKAKIQAKWCAEMIEYTK